MTNNVIKTAFLFSLLAVLFSFAQVSAKGLQGWNIKKGQNFISYTPAHLSRDERFRLTVYSPAESNKAQSKKITVASANRLQRSLGKPLGRWSIKKRTDYSYSVSNMFKNARGKKLFVSYIGMPASNNDFYIIQTVSSLNKKVARLMKQTPVLFENAQQTYRPAHVHNSKPNQTGSQYASKKRGTHYPKPKNTFKRSNKHYYSKATNAKRKSIEKQVRAPPGRGAKLSNIETIWSESYFDAVVGSIVVTPYILFKDKSAYARLSIPPTELDVSKSRRLQIAGDVYKRGRWTIWRRNGSRYEVKSLRTGRWKKLGGTRAISGRRGERVNFKYSAGGGSQTSGSWNYKFILKPNGRFEMDNFTIRSTGGFATPLITNTSRSNKKGSRSGTSVIGDNIGGGTSRHRNNGAKNTGSYSFGDYSITLRHDNGWVHRELFYFDKANKTGMVFGGKRYWTGRYGAGN